MTLKLGLENYVERPPRGGSGRGISSVYFVLRFRGLVTFADRARSTFFATCFVGAFVEIADTSAAKRSVAFDSCM